MRRIFGPGSRLAFRLANSLRLIRQLREAMVSTQMRSANSLLINALTAANGCDVRCEIGEQVSSFWAPTHALMLGDHANEVIYTESRSVT